MDNGRERSDTHKAFCEKMREANELYVRETFQAPEMGDELRRRIRQKQRSMRYKRIGRYGSRTGMTWRARQNSAGKCMSLVISRQSMNSIS